MFDLSCSPEAHGVCMIDRTSHHVWALKCSSLKEGLTGASPGAFPRCPQQISGKNPRNLREAEILAAFSDEGVRGWRRTVAGDVGSGAWCCSLLIHYIFVIICLYIFETCGHASNVCSIDLGGWPRIEHLESLSHIAIVAASGFPFAL